ncbi:MAG: SRPBCC family protein [Chlorobium sp.]|nr:MAG: SRPBCC family protein [Chlorobium sp.]
MSFSVAIKIQKGFETPSAPDKVFGLLADVVRSASHFPKVDQLVDLGGNSFRWEMEKIGIGSYTLQQTIYACRYTSDPVTMKVAWTPIQGVGNAIVSGEWTIIPKGSGTTVTLNTKGDLTVDFPSFLQFIISPLVEMEFGGMIDRYLENLQAGMSKL